MSSKTISKAAHRLLAIKKGSHINYYQYPGGGLSNKVERRAMDMLSQRKLIVITNRVGLDVGSGITRFRVFYEKTQPGVQK